MAGMPPDWLLANPMRRIAPGCVIANPEGSKPDVFWRELADAMSGYFRKSEFTPGIVHGIQKAGELLAEHFPRERMEEK